MLPASTQRGAGVTERCAASEDQKPIAPLPHSSAEMFLLAPTSLKKDLCLLSKLIMKQ